MIVLAKINILAVGINDKAEVLRELPIRVVTLQFGTEAVSSFKFEKFDSVISKWELADMKDGKFLKNLKKSKPDMPTIAILESGNYDQEIAARSLGVSAVLTEGTDDEDFVRIVSQILGLDSVKTIKSIHALEK